VINPRSVQTSVVKKSAARTALQCARRNVCHDVGRLNTTFAPARVNLAKLYLKQNRLDNAIEQLEAARTLDPTDKSAYSQLAIAYRRAGDPAKAGKMLTALNRLNEEERAQAGRRKRLQAVTELAAP
jgi:DNA-binding SARP family transcriptional activator